jgi:SnoaL-like domain
LNDRRLRRRGDDRWQHPTHRRGGPRCPENMHEWVMLERSHPVVRRATVLDRRAQTMATPRELALSNLLRVFGERDAAARRAAIADTYSDDVLFSDPEGDVIGHEAIDAKVEALLAGAPGFVFSAVEPIYESEGRVALAWAFGPAEDPPVVQGIDVMTVRDGRIATLRTMLAAT